MSIVVDPTLESALDEIAQMLTRPAAQIAADAIRSHLEYLHAQQLTVETQAYARLHPELVRRYRNQFVAIHSGKLFDSDMDFETLFLRVQSRLGNLPVLIQQVLESAIEEWHFRSPRRELWGNYFGTTDTKPTAAIPGRSSRSA